MKKFVFLISVVIILSLFLMLVAPPVASPVKAAGSQTWWLGSDNYTGTAASDDTSHVADKLMKKTAGSSATSVTIQGDTYDRAWWYSDEAAQTDVAFGDESWNAKVYVFCSAGDEETDDLHLKIWKVKSDGSVTELANEAKEISTTTTHVAYTFADDLHTLSSFTIPTGWRIGISLHWEGLKDVKIGFNNAVDSVDETWLKSPSSDPGYPLPKLATIILIPAGLAVVILVFMIINRRARAARGK